MKVTPHFDTDEFKQRAWTGGPEVSYPNDWVTERLTPLCLALEELRKELGGRAVTILSGYRTRTFNVAIGGAPKSMHVQGRAADVRVTGVQVAKLHETMLDLVESGVVPQVRGLGYYPRQGFIHVDVRPTIRLVRWEGKHSQVTGS